MYDTLSPSGTVAHTYTTNTQSKINIQGTGLNSNQTHQQNKQTKVFSVEVQKKKNYFELFKQERISKNDKKSWMTLQERLIIYNCIVKRPWRTEMAWWARSLLYSTDED